MISLTFIKAHGEEAVLKEAEETKALLCSDCLHPCCLQFAYRTAVSVNMALIRHKSYLEKWVHPSPKNMTSKLHENVNFDARNTLL